MQIYSCASAHMATIYLPQPISLILAEFLQIHQSSKQTTDLELKFVTTIGIKHATSSGFEIARKHQNRSVPALSTNFFHQQ